MIALINHLLMSICPDPQINSEFENRYRKVKQKIRNNQQSLRQARLAYMSERDAYSYEALVQAKESFEEVKTLKFDGFRQFEKTN